MSENTLNTTVITETEMHVDISRSQLQEFLAQVTRVEGFLDKEIHTIEIKPITSGGNHTAFRVVAKKRVCQLISNSPIANHDY